MRRRDERKEDSRVVRKSEIGLGQSRFVKRATHGW